MRTRLGWWPIGLTVLSATLCFSIASYGQDAAGAGQSAPSKPAAAKAGSGICAPPVTRAWNCCQRIDSRSRSRLSSRIRRGRSSRRGESVYTRKSSAAAAAKTYRSRMAGKRRVRRSMSPGKFGSSARRPLCHSDTWPRRADPAQRCQQGVCS